MTYWGRAALFRLVLQGCSYIYTKELIRQKVSSCLTATFLLPTCHSMWSQSHFLLVLHKLDDRTSSWFSTNLTKELWSIIGWLWLVLLSRIIRYTRIDLQWHQRMTCLLPVLSLAVLYSWLETWQDFKAVIMQVATFFPLHDLFTLHLTRNMIPSCMMGTFFPTMMSMRLNSSERWGQVRGVLVCMALPVLVLEVKKGSRSDDVFTSLNEENLQVLVTEMDWPCFCSDNYQSSQNPRQQKLTHPDARCIHDQLLLWCAACDSISPWQTPENLLPVQFCQ